MFNQVLRQLFSSVTSLIDSYLFCISRAAERHPERWGFHFSSADGHAISSLPAQTATYKRKNKASSSRDDIRPVRVATEDGPWIQAHPRNWKAGETQVHHNEGLQVAGSICLAQATCHVQYKHDIIRFYRICIHKHTIYNYTCLLFTI